MTEEITEPSPHRHVVGVKTGAVAGIPDSPVMTVSDVLAAIRGGQRFTVDSKSDAPSPVVQRQCGGGCDHQTIKALSAEGGRTTSTSSTSSRARNRPTESTVRSVAQAGRGEERRAGP